MLDLNCILLFESSRNFYVIHVLNKFIFYSFSNFPFKSYTESLYALLSFSGLYYFKLNKLFKASFFFALSCATRSNGSLYVGYLLFYLLQKVFLYFINEKKEKDFLKHIIIDSLKIGVNCLIIVSPLICFQYFGYKIYCDSHLSRPWCNDSIPNLYSFVQKYYWYFFSFQEKTNVFNFRYSFITKGIKDF